ncbi:DUF2971 domain-containing protein [Brachyspira pilosicoli]|uniref:DUF2971 domain-containing protein n=1 Tax=Brachyspira pilosicoli TaxID=52584 RepID=UPI003005A5CC
MIKDDIKEYNSTISFYRDFNNIQKGIEHFFNELKNKDKKSHYYLFYFFIGYFYLLLNKHSKAIKYLRKSIKKNKQLFNAYKLLADAFSMQNKYLKSLKYYRMSLRIYAKYNSSDYVNIDDYKSALYRLNALKSDMYTYIKPNLNKAINYLYKAKEHINFWDTEYSFYNKMGILYDKFKKYDDAIKNYEYAIRSINKCSNRNSYIVYSNISISYYKKNDYVNAKKYIDIYISKNKDLTVENYYYKGLYEGLLDNIEEAYNSFLYGLNFDKSSTKSLFDIAKIVYDNNNSFRDRFFDLIKIMLDKDFYIENDNITTVYKYRPIDINTGKLILNSKVRLSDYNYFNDPADPLVKLNKEAFKIVEEYISNIRICSLSPTYDNFLMWSHYSNEHKGICIEYDATNFKESNTKIEKLILKKIIYTNKIRFGNFEHIIAYNNLELDKYFLSLFYIKHKNWKYENEYRFIADTKEEYIDLPIKAIYFGMNASDDDIKLIKSLVKDDTVKFYKMKSDKNNLFNLIREEI